MFQHLDKLGLENLKHTRQVQAIDEARQRVALNGQEKHYYFENYASQKKASPGTLYQLLVTTRLLLSSDILSMKMALLSGDPSRVRALIEPMGEEEALEALSTTYGGAGEPGWDADENHLFSWTSPILHAARSGNLEIFDSVVEKMRKLNLSTDQVILDTIVREGLRRLFTS